MAINFPTWVTDGTPIPAPFLTPAKKVLYRYAACEYALRLHNAGYKWQRGATDTVPDPLTGEVLSSLEIDMLIDAFPSLWAGYPPTWPTPPTEEQVNDYVAGPWSDRNNAACEARRLMRRAAENIDLTWVDWQGMV